MRIVEGGGALGRASGPNIRTVTYHDSEGNMRIVRIILVTALFG